MITQTTQNDIVNMANTVGTTKRRKLRYLRGLDDKSWAILCKGVSFEDVAEDLGLTERNVCSAFFTRNSAKRAMTGMMKEG